MYWNFTDDKRLIKAIELADKPGLLKGFLTELLTKKEMKACVNRFKAMCMINDGMTYNQIEKATGLSSRTIARLMKKYMDNNGASQKVLRKFKSLGKTYFD